MKEKILGTLIIGFVYSFSDKIGKKLWDSKINLNKEIIKNK